MVAEDKVQKVYFHAVINHRVFKFQIMEKKGRFKSHNSISHKSMKIKYKKKKNQIQVHLAKKLSNNKL